MTRRILSIDGGGVKGVFPAAVLTQIEKTIGQPIAGYFDLIAGTSTGALIALALGLGFTSEAILNFYMTKSGEIFVPGLRATLLRTIRAKHESGQLRRALESQFGDRLLGESSTRLVIPSLSLETGEVYIYKTAHHPRLMTDYREKVVEVALATCAAPTLLPAHRAPSGVALIDGGMWANNPTGVAVVEAIGLLRWPAEDVHVLSLGCTSETLNLGSDSLNRGLLYWGPRVVSVFLAAQSKGSMGTAYTLLGGHERVQRISPTTASGRFAVDRVSDLDALKGLGFEIARTWIPRLQSAGFFDSRAEPFEPEYKITQ